MAKQGNEGRSERKFSRGDDGRRGDKNFSGRKSFGERAFRSNENSDRGERKPFGDKPFRRRDDADGGERKSFRGRGDGEQRERKPFGDKPFRRRDDGDGGERKSFRGRKDGEQRERKSFADKPYGEAREDFRSSDRKTGRDNSYKKKDYKKKFREEVLNLEKKEDNGQIRLNKYISNAGICSRREADNLIKAGAVTVNGKVITEMGFKINPGDIVNYGGGVIKSERKVYLLLNKPKDYITTMEDERGRRTVMELIKGATKERLYPVGRLDRNTTGVLLFTNDGELTKKLTHPKYEVKKIYQVTLDKNLRGEDFQQIVDGLELEDGPIKVDDIQFAGDSKSRREVGIEIHSGRNRIVRRIFEKLGYEVIKLDRVYFAGLTKKDLPKGRWRLLDEKEIGWLKMLS